ncbi:hypothetical protein [Kribbella sp. NPDC055071]
MAKGTGTHTRRSVILAVVFAAVTAWIWWSLRPGYRPRCGLKPMYPGDSCISYGSGGGGGTYNELVHAHYHDFRILFWIGLALTLLFVGLAIRAFVRGRRPRARR